MKIITVSGKCSDMCYFAVKDADGKVVYEQHDGYVPSGCGVGGGDYIEVQIDIETGQVVGWNTDRAKQGLAEYIEEQEEYRRNRRR